MARFKRLQNPREAHPGSTDRVLRSGGCRVGEALLVCLLLGGCRSAAPSGVDQAVSAWAAGPVRWLLLEDEKSALRQVRSAADLTRFVSTFWSSRDPDPDAEGNAFKDTFGERVADADRLYDRPGQAGSLTPRGRALILLGPPSILRYVSRSTPTWSPESAGSGQGRPTRLLTEEIWGYPPQSLPEALRRELAERGETELFLTFAERDGQVQLTDGEEALTMVAAAAVRSAAPAEP